MARLPVPGSDDGTWGQLLNDFLNIAHNTDGSLRIEGTVAGKADDTAVVHNVGTESVAGTKTFSTSPVVPTPSSPTHATTKAYVDSAVSAAAGTPATTIISETAFGRSAAVGSATNYAREDHTHGTPTLATFTTIASDQATTSVTVEDIVGLGLAVGIGTYEFEFLIPYTGSVNGGSGMLLALTGPASSFLSYTMDIQAAQTSNGTYYRSAFAVSQAGVSVTTAGNIYVARIRGRVVTTASGTLQPRFGITIGGTTTTAKVGAYGKLVTY